MNISLNDRASDDKCPGDFILRGGLYSRYIEDWLYMIPRHQLCFISFEAYKNDPIKIINEQLSSFLGLNPLSNEEKDVVRKRAIDNKSNKTEFKLKSATKKLLQDLYAPYNHILSKLLGDATISKQW